ncbi:MAG: glycoside hydrolase family 2, partial [Acidobacteriota bacterium]|nr:glycoside hydrolase family 2 [Acidobacteriota bacterium]
MPRPEYPRPQFVRSDWLNLNGIWEFRFDDDNHGLEKGWYASREPFPHQILVPFSFESKKSGIADPSFHGCVWYRRSLNIPAGWAGRRILLNFGAIDYRATVWVNGMVVASHEGGHTPFRCDITGTLRAENVVVVRAEDPPSDRYIPRGKQHWNDQSVSIFYARTTGIWQTVWIEPVSESYMDRVRTTPRHNGTVSFEVSIGQPREYQYITVAITDNGRTIATGMSLADGPRASVSILVAEPKLWSPDTPNLYDVHLELHGPEGMLDEADSYFGFRTVSTQDG